MTLACARQWQTTSEALSNLHECELAANHKGACYCKCGHNLASCARLPSSGTGPGEVPTRKPSEILADRANRHIHYPECPASSGAHPCRCLTLSRT